MSEALCGYLNASVEHGVTGDHVDNIDVVEENESSSMDWGSGTWGGE